MKRTKASPHEPAQIHDTIGGRILMALAARLTNLKASLGAAGDTTIAEWAGVPDYALAYLTRRGKDWRIAHSLLGRGDPNHPPFAAHLARERDRIRVETDGADEAIDLMAMPATRMADLFNQNAQEIGECMLGEIEAAVRFYVDPGLYDEVSSFVFNAHGWRHKSSSDAPERTIELADLQIGAIANAWPFAPRDTPLVMALEWLREAQNGEKRAAEGLGKGRQWPDNAEQAWVDAAKKRAITFTGREPDFIVSERERLTTLRLEILNEQREQVRDLRSSYIERFGKDITEGDGVGYDENDVYRDIENTLRNWRVVWLPDGTQGAVHPDGVAILYEAEKSIRAALAVEHNLAARVARRNLDGYSGDPDFAVARRSIVHDEISVRRDKSKPGDPEHAREAVEALDESVRKHVASFARSITGDDCAAWDNAFASYLESLGEAGKAAAENVRHKASSRSPWALWASGRQATTADNFVGRLAAALWLDVVRPELSRKIELVAAMPISIVRDIASIATAAKGGLSRDSSRNDGPLVVQRDDGNALLTDLLLANIDAMHRITLEHAAAVSNSHLLWPTLEWIKRTVHRQEASGATDPHIIRIPGGDQGLRHALNLKRQNDGAEIRKVLDFLHLLGSASAPGKGRMLTVNRDRIPRAGAGRPGELTVIEVGLLLRPGKARELGLSLPWDVPILPTECLHTIGDHRTKARQINAQQAVVLYMHERRESIALDGSFQFTKAEWSEHANKYGLYHRTHASLADRLFDSLQEPPKRPTLPFYRSGNEPLLVRVGPDRYRMGDTFKPEWDHLLEQGEITIGQSRRGKMSARRRGAETSRHAAKARAERRK